MKLWVTIVIVVCLLLALCAGGLLIRPKILLWRASKEEMIRATSPDNAFDAVLVRTSIWAGDRFGYYVCIVPAGSAFNLRAPVLFAGDIPTDGEWVAMRLEWRGPRYLELHLDDGQVYEFTGYWRSGQFECEIRLVMPSKVYPSGLGGPAEADND